MSPTAQEVVEDPDKAPLLRKIYFARLAGDSTVGDVVEKESVSAIQIGVLSATTIRRMSVLQITKATQITHIGNHNKREHSLYDARLGHSTHPRSKACATCGLNFLNCPGHMGHIELSTPIINPVFVHQVCNVLQALCVNCCQLRISPFYLLAQFPFNPLTTTHEVLLRRLKDIATLCSRYPRCQFCCVSTVSFRLHGLCINASITGSNTAGCPVPIGHISAILNLVPDFHLRVLGLKATNNHPCNCILTALPVIPPVSRPAMHSTNTKTGQPFIMEDAIVSLYRSILMANESLRSLREPVALVNQFLLIQHSYERLVLDQGRQYSIHAFTPPSSSTLIDKQPIKTAIRKQWVGKAGLVRRECMGKRVNCSMRSVVTCDSWLPADTISVPRCMMRQLSKAVQVQAFNVDYVKGRMQAGEVTHLSTTPDNKRVAMEKLATWQNYALHPTDSLLRDNRRWRLFISHYAGLPNTTLPLPLNRQEDAPLPLPTVQVVHSVHLWHIVPLCYGDRILRNGKQLNPFSFIEWPKLAIGHVAWLTLTSGDLCLANRQPTLVQESMLAMKMIISPNPSALSFGCSCAPVEGMRGDYDGDEINIHVPQDPQAIAELEGFMGVHHQVVTGQASKPVIAPIQDAVLAWFWVTQLPEAELGRSVFQQMACNIMFQHQDDLLPRLDHLKRQWERFCYTNPTHPSVYLLGERWLTTGMALFSLCLPKDCYNLRASCKDVLYGQFSRQKAANQFARSTILEIHNGMLLCGPVTSSTLGGKGGVLHHITLHHGQKAALCFVSNVQRMAAMLTLYRFSHSIGLFDCILPDALHTQTIRLVKHNALRISASSSINDRIAVRGEAEMILIKWITKNKTHLSLYNQMSLPCMLGTKGSVSNLIQCTLCLGQQVMDGCSPVNILDPSTFYTLKCNDVERSGLLYADCFSRGLKALAYYIHANAGREALVDGATHTADSGYAMRLGVKLTENDIVQYDHTIRTEGNIIVQFAYNYNTGHENQWIHPAGRFLDVSSCVTTAVSRRAYKGNK